MRRSCIAVASLLLAVPLPVDAQSPDCIVRLRAQAIAAAGGQAADVWLPRFTATLHPAPQAITPAFKTGNNSGSRKARREALGTWQVLRFANAAEASAALASLRLHPDVEWVEPVRTVPLAAVGALRGVGTASSLVPWNIERVRAPEALQLVDPDSQLVVAVIDTGADVLHPELPVWRNDDPPGNGSVADDATDQNGDGLIEAWERDDDDDNGYTDDTFGFDFTDAPGQGGVGDALERDADVDDENGHGTHVAGIVAARGPSALGVAPFVQVMPVRAAFNTRFGGGVLETDDAAAAIVYAVDNGARILNLSWGDTVESRLVREAITYAVENDVLVVAAAGNGGSDAPHFPSGDPRVIAVASVDRAGEASRFSNYGPGIELVAPGEESESGAGILSLAPRRLFPDGVATLRGTSMAAPHVAGAAAILLSRSDRPSARRARALLIAGAHRRDADDWTAHFGHGELDVAAAVQSHDEIVLGVVGPTHAVRGRVVLIGTVLASEPVSFRVFVAIGSTSFELAPWRHGQAVLDTLCNAPLPDNPSLVGELDLVLQAETVGRRREAHLPLDVDLTPPAVDTLFARAAWEAGEARQLVGVSSDDPVRASLLVGGVLLAAHSGFDRRLQLQLAPGPSQSSGATWELMLENQAGWQRRTTIAAPVVLDAWPRGGVARLLDITADFHPSPVAGRSANGRWVIWGRAGNDEARHLQAWTLEAGRWRRVYEAPQSVARPVGFADVTGDGVADLLVHDGFESVWLSNRSGAAFPDSTLFRVRAERALGLLQLDGDAPFEALLSSSDSLFVFDDASQAPPRLLQVLCNPSRRGFNVWGASAAAGDLDSDGNIEIAVGDGEGSITVFERRADRFEVEQQLDSDGVYAYEIAALPDGGFIVGRQDTRDVTGDGFTPVVYEFRRYARTDGSWQSAGAYPFLAPLNALRAGASVCRSAASGAAWVALVQGSCAHILEQQLGLGAEPRDVVPADGEPPAWGDFDGDGDLDFALPTPEGAAVYELLESTRAPHSLTARSAGANRVNLVWTPGSSGLSRLWRRDTAGWGLLGETSAAAWVDSAVVAFVQYEYEVRGVVAGVETGEGARTRVRPQPRPRLESARPLGAALRLVCSNVIAISTVRPAAFSVSSAGQAHTVLQAYRTGGGREVELVLDRPVCGQVAVRVDSLRDDQGGLLEPPSARLDTTFACQPAPFFVRRVTLQAGALVLEFNRAPGPMSLEASAYTLTWAGERVPFAVAEKEGETGVRLQLAGGAEFVGRGLPYQLRLPATLRSADDVPLEEPQAAYTLYAEGRGATALFAYPSPVRAGDREVVFAEARADTRVRIYNLEGELIRELRGAVGGGLRWDLRTVQGQRVPSGAYVFVAEDARGRKRGRLVVVR